MHLQECEVLWVSLFGLIIWRIWKNRNLFIFQNISQPATEIIKASLNWTGQFEASQNNAKPKSLNPYFKEHSKERWVHLFVDGAMERDTEKSTTGGVIRDMDGNWILRFNHYLGSCTLFEAELQGILDGVLVILGKGYKRATIRMDRLEVVKTLTEKDIKDLGITVLRRVQRLIRFEGQWNITYVPRERNLVAARMTKLGLNQKSSLPTFDTPPKEVGILQQDLTFDIIDLLI